MSVSKNVRCPHTYTHESQPCRLREWTTSAASRVEPRIKSHGVSIRHIIIVGITSSRPKSPTDHDSQRDYHIAPSEFFPSHCCTRFFCMRGTWLGTAKSLNSFATLLQLSDHPMFASPNGKALPNTRTERWTVSEDAKQRGQTSCRREKNIPLLGLLGFVSALRFRDAHDPIHEVAHELLEFVQRF